MSYNLLNIDFFKGGDTVERQKSELKKPIGSLIYRFVGISEHIKCHLGLIPCKQIRLFTR